MQEQIDRNVAMTAGDSAAGAPAPAEEGLSSSKARGRFSFGTIGAVYVWILLAVAFAIYIPDLWLRQATLTTVLNDSAVSSMAALALVVPLACRLFDLSVASVMSLSGIIAGWCLANTSLPAGICALIGVASGGVIGLLNAFVVLRLKVDSLIATLGTGAIAAALAIGIAGDQILTERMSDGYTELATAGIGGFNVTFLYVIVVMVVMGFVLEQTPIGRKIYATGFNADSARLMGVGVDRIRLAAFVTSGMLAALAGVLLTARVLAAAPDSGAHYLLPAFAGAFLGATQFRHGRFNPWGTVVAVLLLGTATSGLLLSGAPNWAPEVFTGVVLIGAVALTVRETRPRVRRFRRAASGSSGA